MIHTHSGDENMEINIDFSDKDAHNISFSQDELYQSITLSKKQFNDLIKKLIEYSQGHTDWEEK